MTPTNLVLTIPEPRAVVLKKQPYPKIVPGYALIKVAIAPICIDHQVYERHRFEVFEDAEHLGHEGVGEIIETAPGTRFEVGDRVIVYAHHGCDGDECFVCRRGLSPSHCLRIPMERISAGATLDTASGGVMSALDLPGSMGEIQKACGSPSGGFGFSKYRIAPERMIQKMPDDLSYRHAAAAGCSCGCTYTGMEEANVGPGDVVLVAGVGFIGFGAIINAKYRGATVIALGRNEYRMALASKLGADHIINPDAPDWLDQIQVLTGDLGGCDAVFECSGYPYSQRKCLEAVRRYGYMYMFGFRVGDDTPFPIHLLNEIHNRHVVLTGGHDVRVMDREGLVRMLSAPVVRSKLDTMITHEYNMSEAAEAFETCLTKQTGKVYLYPHEDCPESGPTG